MHKLVRYDLYRAFRQVSTYVLLAITLVFALISALHATFFSGELGSDLVLTFGNTLASGKDILLMLSGCMCGMMIGEDFSIGSYSLGVSSGYSRWKVLGGRTVSCFIVIALMLAEYMLVSAVLSMIYVKVFGFADVDPDDCSVLSARFPLLRAEHALHSAVLRAEKRRSTPQRSVCSST